MLLNLSKLTDSRKSFLCQNSNVDHVVVNYPNSNFVLSAPHGVSQIRLGKHKSKEIGSIATALFLQNACKCSLIAKTKTNNDDANFDETSSYKDDLAKLIKKNKINYLIDIHGLSAKREIDINLGIHLGHHIKGNEVDFDRLCSALTQNGFLVAIDKPFMAGGTTICNSIKKKFKNIFALQLEINSRITNKRQNRHIYAKLLNILIDWIKSLKIHV